MTRASAALSKRQPAAIAPAMEEIERSGRSDRRFGKLVVVWRVVVRYRLQVAAAFAALVVAAGATLAIPQGFKLIVDRGFGGGDGGEIGRYFLALLGIVSVLGLATAVRFYFVSWLGERVVADLRTSVHAHLLTLDPGFFEANRPSEIASRLTADMGIIEQVVATSASIALRNLFIGVGGIVYMVFQSPKLSGLMLLVIPLVVVPIVLLGRRVRGLSRASQDRVAEVGSTASETLGAIRVVQAFTQERREAARFADAVERAFATARRRVATRAVLTALVILLIFGAMTLILWQGAADVVAGRMSGGTITAFVLAAGIVAGSLGALTEVYGDVMRAAGAASRVDELLSERPSITAPLHPHPLPQPPRGAVRFDRVRFRYPTRPEMAALDDVSFAVMPGETVALVGPSGAGKSTVFQLLQRFYDPEAGRIEVDGVALRDADPAEVRARMALVPQESVIFAASAFDNIRYGRPDATEEEVWEAASAANAADFLRALPDGIHSFMGEGGSRLSGGQRQRLAIARAVIRNAPILLLDEATSALDAESERLVQEALERLMAGRTTIVIAHRLATVRRADRILVMENGRIVAQGPHEELVEGKGLYARLARMQLEDAGP
jgi:ATP-binding cassette subfamily B protein